MAKNKVSLKLLIDTKGKRVLFAEAGKEFVDFLFYILSLPVATMVRLLHAQGMVGSLPNLYKSLDNLSEDYMQPCQNKDTFLKPMLPVSSSSVPLLPFDDLQTGKMFYTCPYWCSHVSDDRRAICPTCGKKMTENVPYIPPPPVKVASGGGGIVKRMITYMVTDDLVVTPMSAISSLAMLTRFDIKDVGVLQEKVVNLGMTEAVRLLKASLQSNKVLTDVFC